MGDLVDVFRFDENDESNPPQSLGGQFLVVHVVDHLECPSDLGQPFFLAHIALLLRQISTLATRVHQ